MIGQAVSAYQKFQMDMIGKLSIGSEAIIDEAPFFDEGYIFTQIERLKAEHEDISRELKIASQLNLQSDYETKKREHLKFRMEKIELKMIYFALNSFKSLPLCKTLSHGKDVKVKKLISALEAFQNGDESLAIREFEQYFEDGKVVCGYFLGNKVYGELLLKADHTAKALTHLEYAIQLKVDDMELLVSLRNAYRLLKMQMEQETIEEVIQIFGQRVS